MLKRETQPEHETDQEEESVCFGNNLIFRKIKQVKIQKHQSVNPLGLR